MSKQTKPKGGLLHAGTTIDAAAGEKWEGGQSAWQNSGTSIFDPVLAEVAIRWFCPPGGLIIDPFAGGSVRGIVAAKLGRPYMGVDLSGPQCRANREQAAAICGEGDALPQWFEGNSLDIESLLPPGTFADFIFTCPPYGDLEVYSDDPADLSTMDYDQFREVYAAIIAASLRRLKPNRFAAIVVGDLRDKDGFFRCFPWHTIEAFEAGGARFYNDAVLVTSMGSLPIRITRIFEAARKLGRTHQNFFVFCKGDPWAATKAIGNVDHG